MHHQNNANFKSVPVTKTVCQPVHRYPETVTLKERKEKIDLLLRSADQIPQNRFGHRLPRILLRKQKL